MKELHPNHFKACSAGGYTQSQILHMCPKCEDIGAGNKMVNHIKKCDGSGLTNYYAKKRSKQLKALLASIF